MTTYLSQSLSFSISESFHASQIGHQHDQRKLNEDLKRRDKQQGPDWNDNVGKTSKFDIDVSPCRQFMLAVAFIGVEFSSSFTTIYIVLFLQFLGVPTNLISLPGVICGSSALILLPIIGWFSDKGSNPVTRKVGLMAIGYTTYLVGYAGLVFCAAWKLHPSKTFQSQPNSTFGDVTENVHGFSRYDKQNFTTKDEIKDTFQFYDPNSASNLTFLVTSPVSLISNLYFTNNTQNDDKVSAENNVHDEGVTFVIFVGIISHGLLDMAFDICMSLCRAFVLECTPPALHSRLLVMSTAFGAIASCLIAFIGTFDIPGALGPLFQVDGTPATMIMFSCWILFSLTFCFACTLTTGYTLMKRMKNKDDVNKEENQSNNRFVTGGDNLNSFKKSLSKHSLAKSSTENIFQRANISEPLLTPARMYGKNYYHSTGSRVIEKLNSIDKGNAVLSHRLTENESNVLHENKILDVTFQQQNNEKNDDFENSEGGDTSFSISKSDSEEENDGAARVGNVEERQSKNSGVSSFLATLVNSYSLSMSVIHSNLISDNYRNLKSDEELFNINQINPENQVPVWKNKRILILCTSMYFTMGALLCFSVYSGNVLTIGIYHGDPTGLLGSPGRKLYDKGLRNAALGCLICYLMYSVSSVLTKKLIDIIGEKVQYMLCQVTFLVGYVCLVMFQSEAMYFISSAISGFYRACSFTLGYMLATQFAQEDCTSTTGTGSSSSKTKTKRPTKNLGQVMVLIGMMLPCSYLTMSCIMGPLMNVTGSPFVPMVAGGTNAALSLLVFCLLFVIK